MLLKPSILCLTALVGGLCLAVPSSMVTSAAASNYVQLGTEKKSDTIETIGSAPVKQKKILELGGLRTREAQLPGGLLTRADRMRLRAKRAIQRQKAVSSASRKAALSSPAPIAVEDSNGKRPNDTNFDPDAPGD